MKKRTKHYSPVSDIDKVLPILHRISIFGGLSHKQLKKILGALQSVSFPANRIVFSRGEEPNHIYIIRSGEIQIFVGEQPEWLEVARLTTGDCFGETSVIGIQPHSASAVTAAPTDLIILDRQTLFSYFETDKHLFAQLVLNIAREACRRLRQADNALLHYVTTNLKNGHTTPVDQETTNQ